MFLRARRRLTLLYIVLFGLVVGVFSVVFYVGFATVLRPDFEVAFEQATAHAEEVAYRATIERIGLALVASDLVVVVLVGLAAWSLAARTLRPIRDAHFRQRRFVADASHEMRTPLAAIRGSAEAALAGPATVAELRSALASIVESSERLTRATNDLLILARTDGRLAEPRLERFDLSVVVAEAIEAGRVAGREADGLAVRLAPGLVVRGDPDEVGRIVANLLDNAFQYGGPDVSVSVSTRRTERDAVVEVADDGPGIAGQDLERIFEPFYRVRADALGPPGSGLGLAIAADLAQRNGGRLTVDSRPSAGSTFRLSLPRFR